MKKIFALMLAICLAGCGNPKNDNISSVDNTTNNLVDNSITSNEKVEIKECLFKQKDEHVLPEYATPYFENVIGKTGAEVKTIYGDRFSGRDFEDFKIDEQNIFGTNSTAETYKWEIDYNYTEKSDSGFTYVDFVDKEYYDKKITYVYASFSGSALDVKDYFTEHYGEPVYQDHNSLKGDILGYYLPNGVAEITDRSVTYRDYARLAYDLCEHDLKYAISSSNCADKQSLIEAMDKRTNDVGGFYCAVWNDICHLDEVTFKNNKTEEHDTSYDVDYEIELLNYKVTHSYSEKYADSDNPIGEYVVVEKSKNTGEEQASIQELSFSSDYIELIGLTKSQIKDYFKEDFDSDNETISIKNNSENEMLIWLDFGYDSDVVDTVTQGDKKVTKINIDYPNYTDNVEEWYTEKYGTPNYVLNDNNGGFWVTDNCCISCSGSTDDWSTNIIYWDLGQDAIENVVSVYDACQAITNSQDIGKNMNKQEIISRLKEKFEDTYNSNGKWIYFTNDDTIDFSIENIQILYPSVDADGYTTVVYQNKVYRCELKLKEDNVNVGEYKLTKSNQ
ncbi:MAG: hypothetical protein IJS61_03345 [Firmicutes bacterium]|nr:hypothetical protein [Bacillota bacterium]